MGVGDFYPATETQTNTSYEPAIPQPGIYPRERKSVQWRNISTPMVIEKTLHNSQDAIGVYCDWM